MKIDNNCIVTLQYDLSDADGNHIDSSADDDPMLYLHGSGELIDGLENALQGKSAGDELAVTLSPDEAYGDEDPELIRNFTMAEFDGVDWFVVHDVYSFYFGFLFPPEGVEKPQSAPKSEHVNGATRTRSGPRI